MHFEFHPNRGTTDAIFVLHQLQEKSLERQKKLYHAFVDLGKAYDRVPIELVWWCLRKKGVPEKLVRLIKWMYERATMKVRTPHGDCDSLQIGVGIHKGSVLSPLLFIVVLDTINEECREGLPGEALCADDLSLSTESQRKLGTSMNKWQMVLKNKRLKMKAEKTDIMVSSRAESKTKLKIIKEHGARFQ